jgi:hypothetical protein
MSGKVLEFLAEDLDRKAVSAVLLMSSASQITNKVKRSFKRFSEEAAEAGIA